MSRIKAMFKVISLLPLAIAMSGPSDTASAQGAAPTTAAAIAPASGVWQKHQMRFTFLGFTSTYSCDGLADKLKRLLIVAGARQDAKSFPGACANGFGRPDKFASANLTFYTLAPPAADTGNAPTVAGTWRAVNFVPLAPRELQLGDCELIEQFRDRLLPLFTTRNVDDHTTCVPHQLSGSNFDLKFEAFVALGSKR